MSTRRSRAFLSSLARKTKVEDPMNAKMKLVTLRAKRDRTNLKYEAIQAKIDKLMDSLIQTEQELNALDGEISSMEKIISKDLSPKKAKKFDSVPELPDDDETASSSKFSSDTGIGKDISMDNLSLDDDEISKE